MISEKLSSGQTSICKICPKLSGMKLRIVNLNMLTLSSETCLSQRSNYLGIDQNPEQTKHHKGKKVILKLYLLKILTT